MQDIKNKKEKVYFVTSKIICPECDGQGVIGEVEKKEIHDDDNSVLISVYKKNYPNGSRRIDLKSICFVCDGSGQIKSDVPLKDALIETLDFLTNVNQK